MELLISPGVTAQRSLCLGCCSRANSDCSAQRRKWTVLVPILHFWNSLGKEAPLHLLLFVVADIISFPDCSVRASCYSEKILLCCRDGIASMHVCVCVCIYLCVSVQKSDSSRQAIFCNFPLALFPSGGSVQSSVSYHCLLPNHIMNRRPPKTKFLFF